MPAASRLIMPARSMRRWLTSSASAGASLSVGTKKREIRMALFLLGKKNCNPNGRTNDEGAVQAPSGDRENRPPREVPCAQRLAQRYRTTITGSLLCVSTFCVSLPSSTAEMPRRPCEAITIASHLCFFAAARIASQGAAAIA